MNIRVADIQAIYQTWSERGAQFLTPPINRGPETRCYLRDPDGHLIELGQNNRTHGSADRDASDAAVHSVLDAKAP